MNRALRFAAVLPLLFALYLPGCKKQEEPSYISGRVQVNEGDASGVVVEIYEAVPLSSTSVWYKTNSVPAVGFPYRLQAAFDFRREQSRLRASLSTDGGGGYKSSDLPDGDYVVVARKSGYGWSEPRAVVLNGKSAEAGTVTLAPEIQIGENVTLHGNVTWAAGRHYVLGQRMNVGNDAILTIEPGVVVRLPVGGSVQIMGAIIAEGTEEAYITFTSDEAIPASQDWFYLKFNAGAAPPYFRYCTFSYSDNGVFSSVPGGRIEYCSFYAVGGQAATLIGSSAATSDSIVVRGNVTDRTTVAFVVAQGGNSPLLIERNALYGCSQYGLKLMVVRSGSVYCNWFYNCGRSSGDTLTGLSTTGAIFGRDLKNMEIHRNEFSTSWYGLSLGSLVDSSVFTHHNLFFRVNRVMNIAETPDYRGASFPHLYQNCIKTCPRYYVYVDACLINNKVIDARNNYWDGRGETQIQNDFLYDCHRNTECPCILIAPVLTDCPDEEVGICS